MPSWRTFTRKLAAHGLIPRTRLARFTAYLAAIEIVLLLLDWVLKFVGAANASAFFGGFAGFLGFPLGVALAWLAIHWFRQHVMWSVRNRLIVTYLFIGGVPVTLALAMAVVAGYLVLEHLATFMAVSEIHAQEQRLSAANTDAARQIQQGLSAAGIASEDTVFPGRSITVLPASKAPAWLKSDFAGVVSDNKQLSLRAADSVATKRGRRVVISSVPFDQHFLSVIAAKLGSLTLYPGEVDVNNPPAGNQPSGSDNPDSVRAAAITAGTVSKPAASVDPELNFGGLIQTTDWNSGVAFKNNAKFFLTGTTRLSTIYYYLTASMGIWTGIVGVALGVIAAAFALVVLIALLIGIRLTRTITYSVANLYRATQHINRGEFQHRIKVREKDQLGALQTAFNSMTESLERLIAEQKEKERLQSELEIAHEVQAQLFPQNISGTQTLELHGICRPARIVSGDYYDFLTYGPDQVGIAVGDISGKGISAALLMASIHSAVRAYEQEQLVVVGAEGAYGTNPWSTSLDTRVAPPSPAQMLWLLNRHLYRTTQPEKYATLFLGFYDGDQNRLTYSNAGHLAPILLGKNGSVRRLEAGGMV
ncbi:MAG: PP2C family protein-serine/threonine phosphatase, partial [Candidatus Angelobacter sp.]